MKSKADIMALPSHQRKYELKKRRMRMLREAKVKGIEKEKAKRSKNAMEGRI